MAYVSRDGLQQKLVRRHGGGFHAVYSAKELGKGPKLKAWKISLHTNVVAGFGDGEAAPAAREPGSQGGTAVVQQLVLELGGHEVVEDRIQAAVEARQAEGDGVEAERAPVKGTVLDDVLYHHHEEREVDVVGGEADEEDGRAHQDHAQSLLLLAGVLQLRWTLPQGLPHLPSAAGNDAEGDDKPKQLRHRHQCDGGSWAQLLHPQVREARVCAVGQGWAPHYEQRQARRPDEEPDGSADGCVVPPLPVLGFEGMEEEEVPLDADAGEEANAGIHVEILQVEAHLAKKTSKWPRVVYVVIHP